MLTSPPETEACWRAARPCAGVESRTGDDVSCWAWYRCEKEGDYVIKWKCDATESSPVGNGNVADNSSAFSLCSDQSGLRNSFENCPPPVVCADDPNHGAPIIVPEPGYLSTDLILVIAVAVFAVVAILLTIGSSYKYWSLKRRLRFPFRPGQYVMRDFPYPVRYHHLWGSGGYSHSDLTPDSVKRPSSSLSGDLHVLFPEVNRSRLNLMNINGLQSQALRPDSTSKSFYPDVYFSKHSSETVAVPRSRPAHRAMPDHSSKIGNSRLSAASSGSTSPPHQTQSGQQNPKSAVPLGRGHSEPRRLDITDAAGSFVYHDPKGGSCPQWRMAGSLGQHEIEIPPGDGGRGRGRGRGERGKHGKDGLKNGLRSGRSSPGVERTRDETREAGTRRLRERAGQWWIQPLGRPAESPRIGYSQSDSSEERIHIYRGNLNTTDFTGSRSSASKTNNGTDRAIVRLPLPGNNHTDIVYPSHAAPADARVSSIAIPYHDTITPDMAGIQFSNTEVYPERGQQGRPLPCPPVSPTRLPTHGSTNHTQLIAVNDGRNDSRGGHNIDRPSVGGNVYWPYHIAVRSSGAVDKRTTHRLDKNNTSQKPKGTKRRSRSAGKDTSRYLRVGTAVYRIVPTVRDGTSSSSSTNSLGSAASCSKPALPRAYRVTDLDISYDNFRDDHLRQLARRGGGVASSSTLDACTPPVGDFHCLSREESDHSTSSTGPRPSRF